MDKTNEVISGNYDTLVLSGGSIHVLTILGSIQYAIDNYLLSKVNIFVGTSAGAIACYLISIGYTPKEIIACLCSNDEFKHLSNFNITNMLNGEGIMSYSHINDILEKMTIEKVGSLLTMKRLYDLYGKSLHFVTFNISKDIPEILSHETYPNMPCLIALKMSSNLPFIFPHFKYEDSFYIDGGIVNNFPIDIGDKIGNKVLGITIENTTRTETSEIPESSVVKYFYRIVYIPIIECVANRIDNASDKCTIVQIKNYSKKVFDFDIDNIKVLKMFSSGYSQLKEHFEGKPTTPAATECDSPKTPTLVASAPTLVASPIPTPSTQKIDNDETGMIAILSSPPLIKVIVSSETYETSTPDDDIPV